MLYFSTSQIPELAGLNRNTRQKFVSFAIANMKSDRQITPVLPLLLVIFGGITGTFGSLFLIPLFLPADIIVSPAASSSVDMMSSLIGAASGGGLGGFVGQ